MIKYPVKIHDIDKKLVIQSDNSIVCEAYSEEKALAIANSLNAMNELKITNSKPYLVRYKGKRGIYPVVDTYGDEICILQDFLYEPTPKIRALKIWQNKDLFEIVIL
jgi:hypothetical protein